MHSAVCFDYFYGGEAESFSYYRIPRLLVTGEQFKDLSSAAKLLYGLLLDRMGLSAKNGWLDNLGRVYIYYPLDEVQAALNCSHGKAVKLMAELDAETGIGLIERVRQGLGRPSIVYVKQFISRPAGQPAILSSADGFRDTKSALHEVQKPDFMKDKNHTSRLPIIEPLEVQKSEAFFNCNNYPDNNYLYQSIHQSNQPMDGTDRDRCRALVKERIGYVAFSDHKQTVDELVELITEVLCSPQVTFKIAGTKLKSHIVKERFCQLEQQHIEYVLDSLSQNTTKVCNIRGYLLTTLYNAPVTMEHYYQTKVQHDLYGQESGP